MAGGSTAASKAVPAQFVRGGHVWRPKAPCGGLEVRNGDLESRFRPESAWCQPSLGESARIRDSRSTRRVRTAQVALRLVLDLADRLRLRAQRPPPGIGPSICGDEAEQEDDGPPDEQEQ